MSSTFVVIDDCEVDRYVARRTIRSCGHEEQIVEFADGRDFLDVLNDEAKLAEFRDASPDPYVVVLDINMPLADGFEVAEALTDWEQRNGEECWFVVMMLTSSDRADDRDRAGRCKVVREFATKPLTPEALARIVAQLPAPR